MRSNSLFATKKEIKEFNLMNYIEIKDKEAKFIQKFNNISEKIHNRFKDSGVYEYYLNEFSFPVAKILMFQEYADLIQHFAMDNEVSDENFDKKLEDYVTKRVLDLHRKSEYWFMPKYSKQDRKEKNPKKVLRIEMAKIINYHTNRCGLSEQIIKKYGLEEGLEKIKPIMQEYTRYVEEKTFQMEAPMKGTVPFQDFMRELYSSGREWFNRYMSRNVLSY